MAKELTKKAGISAAESVLSSLMPELFDRIDKLEAKLDRRFSDIDQRLEQLKTHIADRFEQTRDVINELGQRIAKLEGRLDEHFSNLRAQNIKIDSWVERLVKVEIMQSSKRRKAS